MKEFKSKIGQPSVVRKEFTKVEGWLKIRTKVKESKCSNCKTPYAGQDTLALAQVEGKINAHICESCADQFILSGAKDSKKLSDEIAASKELLMKDILEWDTTYKLEGAYYSGRNLKPKKLEELKVIHSKLVKERAEEEIIQQEIEENFVKTEMEEYLKDQYDIYESEYLKHEAYIEGHFTMNGVEYFDCGQGYFQNEVTKIVKIGAVFYEVKIFAEIGSAKQDRGDRLYFVENIKKVTFKVIDKPQPIPKVSKVYTIQATEANQERLRQFLNSTEFHIMNKDL